MNRFQRRESQTIRCWFQLRARPWQHRRQQRAWPWRPRRTWSRGAGPPFSSWSRARQGQQRQRQRRQQRRPSRPRLRAQPVLRARGAPARPAASRTEDGYHRASRQAGGKSGSEAEWKPVCESAWDSSEVFPCWNREGSTCSRVAPARTPHGHENTGRKAAVSAQAPPARRFAHRCALSQGPGARDQ